MIACVTTLATESRDAAEPLPTERQRALANGHAHAARRLRLRRAPFYVYHSFDEATGRVGPVRFLRLFHTSQSTPGPQLP